MDGFVFAFVEVFLDEAEVHRLFDDLGVVEEAEGFPVDGFSEGFFVGLGVRLSSGDV